MEETKNKSITKIESDLISNKSYLNGEWVEGKSTRTVDIKNPYDSTIITTVKLATLHQLNDTFERAHHASIGWAKSTVEDRRSILKKTLQYLQNNKDQIIALLVKDTGGTILKSTIELHLCMDVIEEAIKFADMLTITHEVKAGVDKSNYIHRLPLGVISSISPFNFPLNLSMRTIASAIALGNTVVHKPDIQVALAGGIIIAKAFEYAGLPKGVLNVILTDIEEIGDNMITNTHVKLISFTGSSQVGRHIGAIAGQQLKRVTLELGGNSPFVVLHDADISQAVDAAIFGKFIHQGQICMIINRIIVHQDLYDEFVERFIERVKLLPCGDPSDPSTVIGPLINDIQLKKALSYIETAKREGATVALEGKQVGSVLTPYVFTNVQNNSKLAQTEIFAPIATIIKATSDEEAIQLANDTVYGLSSSIFTSNIEQGKKYALQLDSGMTHINDQTVNDAPNIPFGGNKASGLGRFGNPWIVEEFTIPKWVSVQNEKRNYPF